MSKTRNQKNKERFARFGIATKGFVYLLIGGLTAMTVLGYGGKKTGSSGAIEYLSSGTIGQLLLVLTAVGLIAFVFWRLYQAFEDPEDKGSDFKGIFRRLGYLSSGIFYGFLAFSAIKILIGSGGSGGGKESIISSLLSSTYGQLMVLLLAAVFAGKAIYQLYRAFSGKFKDKVKESGLSKGTRKFILYAGRIGYTARGIVISIIAFLTFRAAISASSSEAGGTEDAFNYLQNNFGSIVLGIIALGLVAYGIFMFIKAGYRKMTLA